MRLRIVTADSAPGGGSWPDVYFTPGYGRAEEVRTGAAWLSLIAEDGAWQMPLLRQDLGDGHWDAVSPYGYAGIHIAPDLLPDRAAKYAQDAVEVLRQEGCVTVFLRHSPLFATSTLPCRRVDVTSDHPVQAVALTTPDAMWAAAEGRMRTAVRKAEKSALTARVRPSEEADFAVSANTFRSLYEATMRRVDARASYSFNDGYYATLLAQLADALQLVEVTDASGLLVAAALIMEHGEVQHYHLSGSDPDAAKQGANNLLLWSAMLHGAGRGNRTFLLGGGLKGEDALYRFKRSFGGQRLAFEATGYVIDEDAYASRTADRARVLRVSTESLLESSFFPAYRSS